MNDSKIINVLKDHFLTSDDTRLEGPIYILPDGTSISPMPKDYSSDMLNHADFEDYLNTVGLSDHVGGFSGDASPTLSELGAIRCSDIEKENNYIELSPKRPTSSQFSALETWLDHNKFNQVAICTPKMVDFVIYDLDDVDHIINRIKRYYSSGTLYEDRKNKIDYLNKSMRDLNNIKLSNEGEYRMTNKHDSNEGYVFSVERDRFDDDESNISYNDYDFYVGSAGGMCECGDCGWFGEKDELIRGKCPDCGGRDIVKESINDKRNAYGNPNVDLKIYNQVRDYLNNHPYDINSDAEDISVEIADNLFDIDYRTTERKTAYSIFAAVQDYLDNLDADFIVDESKSVKVHSKTSDYPFKPINESDNNSVTNNKIYNIVIKTKNGEKTFNGINAKSKDDAINQIIDKLEPTDFIDFYDAFDVTETGDSVDDIIKNNNLVDTKNGYISIVSIDELRGIKESTFRGVPNTKFISHGDWSDPEISTEQDGKTYIANYWDIEDSMWQYYQEEKKYSETKDDDYAKKLKAIYTFDGSDEDFEKFLVNNANQVTNDIIELGKVVESLNEDINEEITYKIIYQYNNDDREEYEYFDDLEKATRYFNSLADPNLCNFVALDKITVDLKTNDEDVETIRYFDADSGLNEDTVKKSNGKWTNRGDDGKEHGIFRTKKAADAQRKAMFANGYKAESKKVVKESDNSDSKRITLVSDRSGIPHSLRNMFNDIFEFREEIEDASRNEYLGIINKYCYRGIFKPFEKTKSYCKYEMQDNVAGYIVKYYLTIIDNSGSDDLGKSKSISVSTKNGMPLSLNDRIRTKYTAADFKREINSTDSQNYAQVVSKYIGSPTPPELYKQTNDKTIFKISDYMGNIDYLTIKESVGNMQSHKSKKVVKEYLSEGSEREYRLLDALYNKEKDTILNILRDLKKYDIIRLYKKTDRGYVYEIKVKPSSNGQCEVTRTAKGNKERPVILDYNDTVDELISYFYVYMHRTPDSLEIRAYYPSTYIGTDSLTEEKHPLQIEIPKIIKYTDIDNLEYEDGSTMTVDDIKSAGFKVRGDSVYLPAGIYDARMFKDTTVYSGFSFKMKDGKWYPFHTYSDDGSVYRIVGKKYDNIDESIINEDTDYDDFELSGIYGGDLTYCPICDAKLRYDEDGGHYCPKCNQDAHSLAMKRRELDKQK